jgi:hypothetical protein
MEIDILVSILETSVKRNGVQPLTNEWLLNIFKLYNRTLDKMEEEALLLEDYPDLNG